MKINILIDNIDSWFIPYGNELGCLLSDKNDVNIVHSHSELEECDVLFLLSCTKLCPSEILKLNSNNIVIHASDLPRGRGWTPFFWQIMEGENIIHLTLFEAVEAIDAGDYYLKDSIELDGTELYDELHEKLGNKIVEMAVHYIENYPMLAHKQTGKPTYYRKIATSDNELDINKTIAEQFNLMRVCRNRVHPAHFYINGIKYILEIYKDSTNQ